MSLFCKQCGHSNHSDASFCDACGVPFTSLGLGKKIAPKLDAKRSRRFWIIAILMLFNTSGLTAALFVPWGVGNASSLEDYKQGIIDRDYQAQKASDQAHEQAFEKLESQSMIEGMRQNPILLVVFMVGIAGFFLSLGAIWRAKKIGKVTCNRCGHVGKLKPTIFFKLVCSHCGVDDWNMAAQPTFDQNAHIFCSECGTQCPANTAFCTKCGNKMGGA